MYQNVYQLVLWEDGQVVLENILESIKEPCGGKTHRL